MIVQLCQACWFSAHFCHATYANEYFVLFPKADIPKQNLAFFVFAFISPLQANLITNVINEIRNAI